jgi:uncharacterized protein YggE
MLNGTRNWLVALAGAVALLALGVICGAVISQATVQAQTVPSGSQTTNATKQGVTVSGQGIVLVKPDLVKLTVGVTEQANTVAEAQQKVNTTHDAIVKALTGLGVSANDIQTSNYSISPNYRNDGTGNSKLNGYQVETQLLVTIRKVEDAGKVIDGASNAGANQIGNIQFTLANNADAVKQARLAAVQDAKAKADQLAAAGGFQAGAVLAVEETSLNTPRPIMYAAGPAMKAADSAATSIDSGQFQVEVNVQVTYAVK